MTDSIDILIDEGEESLLVGVESESCSVLVVADDDVDDDVLDEAVSTARKETEHSRRVRE